MAAQMLEQGFDSNSADYDGRTALMLSAGKGHTGVRCSSCALAAAKASQAWCCERTTCKLSAAAHAAGTFIQR